MCPRSFGPPQPHAHFVRGKFVFRSACQRILEQQQFVNKVEGFHVLEHLSPARLFVVEGEGGYRKFMVSLPK